MLPPRPQDRKGRGPKGLLAAILSALLGLCGCRGAEAPPPAPGDPPPPPAAEGRTEAPARRGLRHVPPPETVALLPFRDASGWRHGAPYAAAFTWLTELAAADVVGLRPLPPVRRRGPGAAEADDGKDAAPSRAWSAEEVAFARVAADHAIAGSFTRSRGRLHLTVWRCPRAEPDACDRFEETTSEKSPYAALARLLEAAFEAAGGRVPGPCRAAWEEGVTGDPYAFLWLGRAALPFLRGDDAERPLRRALRIDPRMAEAWAMWAEVLDRRGGEDRQDPLDALARADLLRSAFTAVKREMARIHLRRGEPERALAALESLAALRPEDLDLALERAELLLSLGRPEEAGRALDGLPADRAATVPVGRLRARIALDRERFDEAESWLERVTDAAPEDAQARLWLAALTRRRGAFREAERWYRQALAAGGGAEARVGLMQLMAEGRRWEEALGEARLLIAEHPGEGRFRRWEAWLLAAAGRPAEAARVYAELVEAAPEDPRPWLGLCSSLLRAGERAEAERACRAATEVDEGEALAWLGLAEALHAQARPEEAREAAERAVTLDPDLKEGHRLLARLHPPGSVEARLAAARARLP